VDLALAGKHVIVTGGASNIGRALSRAFGHEGATVMIADRDLPQAERTAGEIIGNGGRAHAIEVDVTDVVAMQAAATDIEGRIGPVDVLVNNVGWNGHHEFFLQLGPQRWAESFRLNLFSTLCATHAVLPYMVQRLYGSIVNISSDAAFGDYRVADYGAMKAGVLSFTRSIAKEYGRYGIRANAIMPGMVIPAAGDIGEGSYWNADTGVGAKEIADIERRTPLKRRSEAVDVAWSAVFLASDKARQITGQTISVSGGFAMPR
jgi:NAD(P)-dependent dehydrogenase (short-subunit alcohol dehydrogenase family)